jgi:hypothetical protein
MTDKKDPIASIRGKLSAQAKLEHIDPGRFLTVYFHEGFLMRVSSSPYRDQLILKGGLSLYGRYGMLARPTVDVDLDVMNEIRAFLEPILTDSTQGTWQPSEAHWQD